ncbi:hypothetical protein FQZ97_573000 [compost metagenome]
MHFAVGEGQLDGFGEQMDIGRGVVAQRAQVARLQDVQHLQQRRPLAPEAATVDLGAAEVGNERGVDVDGEGSQVVVGDEAAFFLVVLDDGGGYVAFVEGAAGGGQASQAALALAQAFFVGHVLEAGGQIGLAEDGPRGRRFAAGQVDGRAGSPAGVVLFVLGQDFRHQRVHDEAVAGQPYRTGGDVAEAHRAEAFQGSNPGVGRRWNDGAQDAGRYRAAVLFQECFQPGRLGPIAQARDAGHAARAGLVDQDGRDAAEVHDVALHDAQRDPGRHARIDRVAAGLQDVHAGLRGQVVASRDHVVQAGQRGPHGGGGAARGQIGRVGRCGHRGLRYGAVCAGARCARGRGRQVTAV